MNPPEICLLALRATITLSALAGFADSREEGKVQKKVDREVGGQTPPLGGPGDLFPFLPHSQPKSWFPGGFCASPHP